MKPFFLLFTAGIFAASPLHAGDYESCNAYGEMNQRLGCNSDNYLLQFGRKYCREFVERNDEFQPETQAVLKSIRDCLIRDIQTDSELTCASSEDRAIESHDRCYVSSGFCHLNFLEKMKIWWVVKREATRPSFSTAMHDIAAACNPYSSRP